MATGGREIVLRGITWAHDRGLAPLVATARAFEDEDPRVRIEWEVRSLQAFADEPVDALTRRYDLVILDHPSIGYAVARGCLVPLDGELDAGFLAEQAASSVGRSHESYRWEGHQWALAIDAAAQVSSFRPDLLERVGADVPRTWEGVLALAQAVRRIGAWVAIPLIPVDALLSFFSLCVAMGREPFDDGDLTSGVPARRALDVLGRLSAAAHPGSLGWNPPSTYERMARTDEVAYCPLAFGYSNYARRGYRGSVLRFSNAPATAAGVPAGTLGGTGLAVSAQSRHREVGCRYARFVASPPVQRTTYASAGGQPGHRSAWADDDVNAATQGYFRDTLASLEHAYLRPRQDGYLAFQSRAGELIHAFLREGGDADAVLDRLGGLYREGAEVRG